MMNSEVAEYAVETVKEWRQKGYIPWNSPSLEKIYHNGIIKQTADVVRIECNLDWMHQTYLEAMLYSNARLLISELAEFPYETSDTILYNVALNHGTTFSIDAMIAWIQKLQTTRSASEFTVMCQLFNSLKNYIDLDHDPEDFGLRINMELLPDLATISRTWTAWDMIQLLSACLHSVICYPEACSECNADQANLMLWMCKQLDMPYTEIRLATLQKQYLLNNDNGERLLGFCFWMANEDWANISYKDIRDSIAYIVSGASGHPHGYEECDVADRKFYNEVSKIMVEKFQTLEPHYDVGHLRGWYADDWHQILDAGVVLAAIRDSISKIDNGGITL